MGGLAGYVGRRPVEESQRTVHTMLQALRNERDCVISVFTCGELGATVGTAAKAFAQDCFIKHNESDSITVAWLGECFEKTTVLDRLRAAGHQLEPTGCDWMLHSYEEDGQAAVSRFNGLFSAVFIDAASRAVYLCNDRYGIRRVYYHVSSDGVFFATEAKALLRVLPQLRRMNTAGMADLIEFGCVVGEHTLFEGVRVLPAAAWWRLDLDRIVRGTYFTPEEWQSREALSPIAFAEQMGSALRDQLPLYCQGEVALSLTGGLDTRLLLAFWPSARPLPPAFTFDGFSGETHDTRTAAAVARALHIPHHTIRLREEFLRQFDHWADEAVYVTDGTLGITGAHEVFLHQDARRIAPIRLTGNFGSEIFRGAATLKPIQIRPRILSAVARRELANSRRTGYVPDGNPVTEAAFRGIGAKLFGNMAASRRYVTYRTPYLDNRLVELAHRAPHTLPLDSRTTLEYIESQNSLLASIETDMAISVAKQHLRRTLLTRSLARKLSFKGDYLFNEGMPGPLGMLDPVWRLGLAAGVLGRHKYLHYRTWFRRELADYLQSRLATQRVRENPLWDRAVIRQIGNQHVAGVVNWSSEIDLVLTIDAVERTLLAA